MPPVDESRLDDAPALEALDTRSSLRALATAGAQVRRSVVAAREAGVERVAGGERPRSLLVASLGMSSVVSQVLELLAEPGSPVPVTTRSSGPLPGWVGPLDLVIAVSQSGRAAGPVALAAEAARRGAALVTVGAADSPLADVCARARGVHVAPGIEAPSSRTGLWSLLTPALVAANACGVIDCPDTVLESVAVRLDARAEECRPSSESFVNPAKALALDLAEGVPVVLGDDALSGVAAARFAGMLARTARIPATHGALPESAAEVVACFDGPYAATAGSALTESAGRDLFADPYLDGPPTPRLSLLLLRDAPGIDPADRERGAFGIQRAALADAIVESAHGAGVRVHEVSANPGAPVERLADLVSMGDYVATYLALAFGIDPSVSRHVTDLRDRTE
jgi:glucose/mannose-6-phosphate isomerase